MVQTAFGPTCFDEGDQVRVFKNPTRAFRAITRILVIPEYRLPVLTGLVLSVGSQIRPSANASLPLLSLLSYPLPHLLTTSFSLPNAFRQQSPLQSPPYTSLTSSSNPPPRSRSSAATSTVTEDGNEQRGKVKSIPRLMDGATLSANAILAGGEEGLVARAVACFWARVSDG